MPEFAKLQRVSLSIIMITNEVNRGKGLSYIRERRGKTGANPARSRHCEGRGKLQAYAGHCRFVDGKAQLDDEP
jgi:hypothetical protein